MPRRIDVRTGGIMRAVGHAANERLTPLVASNTSLSQITLTTKMWASWILSECSQ